MTRTTATVATILALLACATPARAQGGRWAPWVGCWDMVRENATEGRAIPGFTDPVGPTGQAKPGSPRVCVASGTENRATLTTTVEGQPALEQTIVSDGSETAITDSTCRGTQRAQWSANGQRLFTRAELTCSGGPTRSVSGLSLIAPDGTWLEIRSVRMGSNENTRVSRYRRAPGYSGPPIFGATLTINDVKEISAKASPRVIEAALVETNAGFNLTSRQLIELANAKVPNNVLDLMVALSYPQRFVVERTARRDSGGGFFNNDPFYSSFGSPFGFYDPFYDDLIYPSYYYSPFAYSYLGRYDARYFGYPYFGFGGYYDGIVSGGGGGVPNTPQPSGSGRFVNGVGYTRVRPREAEPVGGGASGGQTASTTRSGGGTMTPQGYSGGSSSSGSSGGSSGGGSSAASSGGGGGRTAQAR